MYSINVIQINYHENETIIFESINVNYTIEEIKRKIQNQINIPIQEQILVYGGKELEEDKKSLKDYGFQEYMNSPNIFELYLGHKNGILIHIQSKSRGKLKYSFRPNTKIEYIKQKISEYTDLPTEIQILSYNDIELKNENALMDYNVQNKSTINLIFRAKNGIIIFIRRPTGKIIPLDISISTKISQIKELIHEKDNLPIEHQKIKYCGKELDDNDTLLSLNIQPGDFIEAIFKSTSGYEIFIKTLTGKTITLYVESYFTIENVKELG